MVSQFFLEHALQGRQILTYLTVFLSYLFSPISVLLRFFHFRVLEHDLNIGNLCTQIDAYVKERRLQRVPNYRMIIYSHFNPIISRRPFCLHSANNYFSHLWKQHFIVVTNPLLGFFLKPILTAPWLKYERPYFSEFPDQSFYAVNEKYYQRFPEYSRELAILRLPKKNQNKGWKTLKTFGMSENDWFVCFYARELGYYDIKDQNNQGIIRNVQVLTYQRALQEIINRGGWCIRIGSSKMQPLPKPLLGIDRVIDYPKTNIVSDFMDVFLLGTCRFLLTCSSGISMMPGLFGNPIVMTNVIPMHIAKPLYPKDITILKRYYSRLFKRELSFSEVFSFYVTDQTNSYYYDSLHLDVIDNTEDEILQVTKEMLDRLENRFVIPDDYQLLQNKFHEIIPEYLFCKTGTGRLGYNFLKTYEHLLCFK